MTTESSIPLARGETGPVAPAGQSASPAHGGLASPAPGQHVPLTTAERIAIGVNLPPLLEREVRASAGLRAALADITGRYGVRRVTMVDLLVYRANELIRRARTEAPRG